MPSIFVIKLLTNRLISISVGRTVIRKRLCTGPPQFGIFSLVLSNTDEEEFFGNLQQSGFSVFRSDFDLVIMVSAIGSFTL